MCLKAFSAATVSLCLLALGALASAQDASSAPKIPSCRLDSSKNAILQATLKRAIGAYAAMGKQLPVSKVAINPVSPSADPQTLDVYVVLDAPKGATDAGGCATRTPGEADAVDPLSVLGGCVVAAVDRPEMRCSSSAVQVFAKAGRSEERESIALLYVVAHELGHLKQRRLGEYAGRVEQIDLGTAPSARIDALREACDPVSLKVEEETDAMSFDVLVKLVGEAPYREPILSERGSVYSNIDQLALASNGWQLLNARRDFVSKPKVHPSFEPQNFPTPDKEIEKNAKTFVCAALKGKKGTIYYPGRSISHPPMEQRLQRMAEKLKPVAEGLPTKPGDPNFKPVAILQGDLGPILTFIYRETGVYMKSLQNKICTRLNGPRPDAGCT
ncbi:hypothetical protein CQ14_09545 [Bradyrhizobium lablabi]|uniref:Uncharacterized protein n=1 Tax=Bradyrhizobium lablabi TaxID=722472 RepID=A0A0R3N620_9BRAD|nr:hypothetical protein [Bradyrhizobium lablabi]KRR25251.1 hypothetical protein CQ14_09545 [Bradyrhizobium lablabi]